MFNDESMFADIRKAIKEQKENKNNQNFKDILKFTMPKDGNTNTYVIRLLPNVKDPSNTFFKYISYDWNSFSTGKWLKVISPVTFGERCPIQELKARIYNSKNSTEEEKNKIREIRRREHWLVNVYVIDDPVDPSNNGTVKIIDIGRQLMGKIESALSDDDPDSLGNDIFLKSKTSNGYNFKVIIKKEAAYPTYNDSAFTRKMFTIPGIEDNQELIAKIYESTFDLKTIYPVKSYKELEDVLQEHYFVSVDTISNNTSTNAATSNIVSNDPDDMSFEEDNTLSSDEKIEVDDILKNMESPKSNKSKTEAASIDDVDDDFINDILNQ